VLHVSLCTTWDRSRDSLEDIVWVRGGEAEASLTSSWEASETSSLSSRSSSLQTLLTKLVIQIPLLLPVSMVCYSMVAELTGSDNTSYASPTFLNFSSAAARLSPGFLSVHELSRVTLDTKTGLPGCHFSDSLR